MEKRISKKIIVLVILLFSLIFEFSAFTSTHKFKDNTVYVAINKQDTTEEQIKEELKPNVVKPLREHYQNDDVVGKLTIEGTAIDTPVMQTTDNSYYLNHNEYGAYQAEGSLYADYRVSLDGKKVLIFGHSSPGWNVPFNDLEKYYEKSFYDTHKYITLVSLEKTYTYEIFSVHIETSDFSYMNLNIDEDTYKNYLLKYKDKSIYNTRAKVDNDDILILQTCSNHPEYQNYKKKYLLVVAKKIREEKNEKD